MTNHRAWRRWLLALWLLAGAAAAAVVGLGEALIQPYRPTIGSPPAALGASNVVLRSESGLKVAGWLSRGAVGHGAVLLVHGVRASRVEMLDRGLFLHRLGFSVLLIDLPAHGESEAAHIGYGLQEAQAVRSALAYLAAKFPNEKVGVIGVSLGAAALVLSEPAQGVSAVVLESMFPTIRAALSNRLHAAAGPFGEPLTPVLLWLFELRLGVRPEQLEPISKIAGLRAPLLIASGTADRFTTAAETEALYRAANEPKALWLVPGAGHVDLHAYDPKAYEDQIGAFLAIHLK